MLDTPPVSTRRELTICFADMAGFTALTEAHGDEHAAEFASRFAEIARAALAPGDRLVKTIGDAVMLTSADPESGLALVERLVAAATELGGFPVLRVGLHHGPVVERDGDVFGACVNLAARIAASAGGQQVLGTAAVAAAARAAGLEAASLGLVSFKNVREPIEIFRLAIGPAVEGLIDPVCHMRVEPATAAGMLRHAGREVWFCSLECLDAFKADPKAYGKPQI